MGGGDEGCYVAIVVASIKSLPSPPPHTKVYKNIVDIFRLGLYRHIILQTVNVSIDATFISSSVKWLMLN